MPSKRSEIILIIWILLIIRHYAFSLSVRMQSDYLLLSRSNAVSFFYVYNL